MFIIEFVGALHPELRRPRWMFVIVGLSLILFLATMLTINTACGWVRRSMVEAVAVWLLTPVLCLCPAWLGAPLILTRRMHRRMLAVHQRSRAATIDHGAFDTNAASAKGAPANAVAEAPAKAPTKAPAKASRSESTIKEQVSLRFLTQSSYSSRVASLAWRKKTLLRKRNQMLRFAPIIILVTMCYCFCGLFIGMYSTFMTANNVTAVNNHSRNGNATMGGAVDGAATAPFAGTIWSSIYILIYYAGNGLFRSVAHKIIAIGGVDREQDRAMQRAVIMRSSCAFDSYKYFFLLSLYPQVRSIEHFAAIEASGLVLFNFYIFLRLSSTGIHLMDTVAGCARKFCGRAPKQRQSRRTTSMFQTTEKQSFENATRAKWMALYSVKGIVSLTASLSSLIILVVFVRNVPYLRVHFPGVDSLDEDAFAQLVAYLAIHLGIDIVRWGTFYVIVQRGSTWCGCLCHKWEKASRAMDLAMKSDGRLQFSCAVIIAHVISDPIFLSMSLQFAVDGNVVAAGRANGTDV